MERVSTGIGGLDDLLEGGFPKGTIIELSGSAGTGKTIFALQFLVEGAKRGKKALFVTFDQPEESIMEQASQFWDIEKLIKDGKLRIARAHYPELVLESQVASAKMLQKAQAVPKAFASINKEIDGFKPEIVAIDSISALTDVICPDHQETREIISELMGIIRSKKVTTLLTSELPENDKGLSRDGMSEFIVDGVIKLTRAEVLGTRSVIVKKMRSTKTDLSAKDFSIDKGGVTVVRGKK